MRQVDLGAAQHLPSPFYGVKFLYDYGLTGVTIFASLLNDWFSRISNLIFSRIFLQTATLLCLHLRMLKG